MKPVFRAVALAVAVSDYLGGNVHAKRFIGRPSRRPGLWAIGSRRGAVVLAAIVRGVGVRSRFGRVGDRSGGSVIPQATLGVRRVGGVAIVRRRGPVALWAILRATGKRSRSGRVGDRFGRSVIPQATLGRCRVGGVAIVRRRGPVAL